MNKTRVYGVGHVEVAPGVGVGLATNYPVGVATDAAVGLIGADLFLFPSIRLLPWMGFS
jgi:hypothetical protein